MMEGHGLDIDMDDLGLGGIGEMVDIPDGGPDQGGAPEGQVDWKKRMQERNNRRIDQQVARLAPALNEEQTAQSREHLESKTGSLFENVIIGGADGATGVFSIETSESE